MTTYNDIPQWIADNKSDFIPPVCNKCMFSNQLKVFFVGGPNQRKDYHLEEGEELFYQRKGSMVLKVVEQGIPKDIVIGEGELFMLPSRVEHSPQRFENTIGMVVERERKNTEFDCVRYFVENSNDILFERWFHLKDVVKDLPPLINEFRQSEEAKLGRPGINSKIVNAPYEPRSVTLEKPLNRKEFIDMYGKEAENKPVVIYGAPKYKTEVVLRGKGLHVLESDVEILIWMQENSEAVVDELQLGEEIIVRVDAGKRVQFNITKGYAITIKMNNTR